MRIDPWTLYWQADHRDSCVATASQQDAEGIAALWREFAGGLGESADVLDLATGNGAVPAVLLQGNASLRVTGVDLAKIDPVTFLSVPDDMQKVSFMGGVDVCQLPFDADQFDAVTSQFGIEYADIEKAVAEAVRVLRPGGKLAFLMHHADSAVVSPAKTRLTEMAALLETGGVIDELTRFVAGRAGFASLDAAGKKHLAADIERTAGVTGQVFEGVKRLVQLIQAGSVDAARELAATISVRLTADRDRLSQMVSAARNEDEFRALVERLENRGLNVDAAGAWSLGGDAAAEYVVAWRLLCSKTAAAS